MITKENFKKILLNLNFKKSGEVFTKHFGDSNVSLQADFKAQKLIYPENNGLIIHNRTICNFSDNENFVVFECVHRLFEKGYKPEHVELEPKFPSGHGSSGGRADILVNDNSKKSMLIIECKTAGSEYKKAWESALNGVTQIFAYAQNRRSTKFVCLYASDFVGNDLKYENNIISLVDDENLIKVTDGAKTFRYQEAEQVEDIYKVWKDTYSLHFTTKGIFEDGIRPYEIGKKKYTLSDLDLVSSDKEVQSKYHRFATILRQHNVSGRENAFDKLVNLFLCKIVDETRNPKDLKFYWKGAAYDSPFDLQDRLQKLYKDGMKEFLNEDVTYVDEMSIRNAFHFVKEKPDATQSKVMEYFRELKFFTNNDFAFLDVHNENLFHQNFRVLQKIVEMLQDLRLQSEKQNQFLGDMFEGFLDQGIKQSEGQFFTPSPITKFIVMSLPLENIVKTCEKPPRSMDYACGAGHFLNELALQLKPIVSKQSQGNIKDFYGQIYGIEKEYRLSKVAKVSAFMYGQDEINIIYGDALAHLNKNKHKSSSEIQNDSFDILIANPPYSVKGFLETLDKDELAQYSLVQTVEPKSFTTNRVIEAFFIERAKQLLKTNGVAGIIVPASVLTNGTEKYPVQKENTYVSTREILLKFFDIVAIVELGGQTFGKTGTKTVVLFLRRKDSNPASAEHYQNRVDAWFDGNENQSVFQDEHFLSSYCAHVEVAIDDYKTLLHGKPNESLLTTETFQGYQKEFSLLADVKNLKKRPSFKSLEDQKQRIELDKLFLKYVQEIEKDKLLYFTLASTNPQKVLVVKTPPTDKEEKEFLGYDWSDAKGKEGINYFSGYSKGAVELIDDADTQTVQIAENQSNLSRIKTPLYDPKNRDNTEKINTYIERNFNGEDFDIPESLKNVLSSVRLVDMLDFTRTDFNKAISLTPKKERNNSD